MSETGTVARFLPQTRLEPVSGPTTPFRFDFRIEPVCRVNARTGMATITGTLECPAAARFSIDVTLSQGTGRSLIHAYGAITLSHKGAGSATWRIHLRAWDGFFTAGPASVSGYAEGSGPGVRDCWSELIEPMQIELVDLS